MAQRKRGGGGETVSFVGGLIMGFIVSAPIAAWLSPRSGPETREGIRRRGLIIRRKATQTVLKPVEQVQQQIEQLQAKVGQIRSESIEDALEEGKAIAAQVKDRLAG